MRFEVGAKTDVGRKREINQDSILVDHDLQLYLVADGMGGHRGGEVASDLAVKTVQSRVKQGLKQPKVQAKQVLIRAYKEASERIHYKSTFENPELMGMGTTMVGAFQYGPKLYIANVGDSRAYLLREGSIWQLTEDHSLVNEQLRAGVISEAEAEIGAKNVITRSVGFEKEVIVDVLEREVEEGDLFLLCSDGLSGLLTSEQMTEICFNNSLEDAVKMFIDLANEAGGDDNISVVLMKAVAS